MGQRMRICELGSHLAGRIPKAIPKQRGGSEGLGVEMAPIPKQVELRKQWYKPATLPEGVRVDKLHPEQDIGDSRGRERW